MKCARLNSLVKEKPILDPGNRNCNLVLLLLQAGASAPKVLTMHFMEKKLYGINSRNDRC